MLAEAESTVEDQSGAHDSSANFNLDGLIMDFWCSMEDRFLSDFLGENIVELFHQEVEAYPEFFVAHYKHKVATKLIQQINRFKAEFVTATEAEWLKFLTLEKKNLQFWDNKAAYKPKDLNLEVLRAAFSLLVAMPIKADIKHDWYLLETKIATIQEA